MSLIRHRVLERKSMYRQHTNSSVGSLGIPVPPISLIVAASSVNGEKRNQPPAYWSLNLDIAGDLGEFSVLSLSLAQSAVWSENPSIVLWSVWLTHYGVSGHT